MLWQLQRVVPWRLHRIAGKYRGTARHLLLHRVFSQKSTIKVHLQEESIHHRSSKNSKNSKKSKNSKNSKDSKDSKKFKNSKNSQDYQFNRCQAESTQEIHVCPGASFRSTQSKQTIHEVTESSQLWKCYWRAHRRSWKGGSKTKKDCEEKESKAGG